MSTRPATGRPREYTPRLGARIIERILAGVSFEAAAGSCGISKRALWKWLAEGRRAVARSGEGLAHVLPDSISDGPLYEPPTLAALYEAVHQARSEARARHEAGFALHARTDWRASYAWLRHRHNDAWGDNPERDDLAPKRRPKPPAATTTLRTDLSDELAAARARLAALRDIIARGGSAALSLDRAIVLEAGTMAVIGRLVKAQHDVNPGAGKAGDFRVSVELTDGAASVDMGERVPKLDPKSSGKSTRSPLKPETQPEVKRRPVGGSGWDE